MRAAWTPTGPYDVFLPMNVSLFVLSLFGEKVKDRDPKRAAQLNREHLWSRAAVTNDIALRGSGGDQYDCERWRRIGPRKLAFIRFRIVPHHRP